MSFSNLLVSQASEKCIVEMLPLLQRALGEQVELVLVGGPGLPKAMVDAAQFDHALLNLCLNARDAMPAGGRLRIESAACWLEADAQTTRAAGKVRAITTRCAPPATSRRGAPAAN